ncbi:MAG: LolA-like putative outer membrane lipoprotein chaperone [Bacteroides sp.]
MRSYLFTLLLVCTLPLFAQQQAEAKVVLDRTAAAFEKAGGVKAHFRMQAFKNNRSLGESDGIIQLKGAKFVLKTPESITWFDGRTQWSYLTGSNEVNISTPTPGELQSINPYALLSLYQKGFAYRLGVVKSLRGKSVYEVILTATSLRQELSRIVLYVAKESYQPITINVEMRDKSRSLITVTGYQAGLKYPDKVFVFNPKLYPRAEMIDLR